MKELSPNRLKGSQIFPGLLSVLNQEPEAQRALISLYRTHPESSEIMDATCYCYLRISEVLICKARIPRNLTAAADNQGLLQGLPREV